MKRLVVAIATSVLLLTGCTAQDDNPTATAPDTARPAAGSIPAEAEPLLATYRVAGKNTVEVIDHLDRLAVKDRPAELRASVRAHVLVISDGAREFNLAVPDDRFYLSVAPYVNRTHECFYHSLTTCKGELAGKDVHVKIVAGTSGAVLVDEVRTTFDNGFIGFWLPRDITGTLAITYGDKASETTIGTGDDAPTCLTTLRLT